MSIYNISIQAKFWSKVDVREFNECWEWQGAKFPSGYGVFTVNKNFRAHRLSWEIANNQLIPEGMFVLHYCDNPSCVNFNHLFIGTHQDNMKDMMNKNRQNDGEDRWCAKLIEEEVIDIRIKYASGFYTQKDLAKIYNTTQSNISDIILNKIWKNIGD